MRAQNLTISIPDKGCDKHCPYCISRITPEQPVNERLIKRNMNKVVKAAQAAQVNSVLITGKGEPLLNMKDVLKVCKIFRDYPLEIQTNGIRLHASNDLVHTLHDVGVDIIALSVDNIDNFQDYTPIIERMYVYGITCRVTFNVTNLLSLEEVTFKRLLELCKSYGVRQMLLRRIMYPEGYEDSGISQVLWIKKNVDSRMYDRLRHNMGSYCAEEGGRRIRKTSFGTEIWDCMNVSVALSDYCVQEESEDNEIRSLIFQQDGHLYTSWDSKASILF